MTQEQAAETLGISPNYVSNIETGRDICSTVVLLGMANLYHASVDYMLGESLEYNRRREKRERIGRRCSTRSDVCKRRSVAICCGISS